MTLPLLVHNDFTRNLFLVVGFGLTLLFYQITNRFHWKKPKLLKFDAIDKRAPFWPRTVWIYFTEYIIFLGAYFLLTDFTNMTRYVLAYLFILVVSCTIFVLYPVTFPRDDYPLDKYPDNWSKKAMLVLRNHLDTPANCLPSLHVSSCYISSFAFWFENTVLFWIFFAWSTLVAVSTLTTKQHYFVDVWTAMLLTAFSFWLFFYGFTYASPVG